MELLKRILMAVFFIPSILIIFFAGDIVLASFLALVVCALNFELREIFIKNGINIPRIVLVLNILVFVMAAMFSFYHVLASLFLIFIIVAGIDIFRSRIKGSFYRISASVFFSIYTAVFLSSIYQIRLLANGGYFLFSLIGLVWLTDSTAYFAGRYWGKHRGIFAASPNKSAEGYIAAIIMSVLAAFVFGYFGNFHLFQTISLAVAVGIFGQLGDLFESMLKRDANVKDSSSFLPGHGGVLDRFDSLIFAAPAFYLLLSLCN